MSGTGTQFLMPARKFGSSSWNRDLNDLTGLWVTLGGTKNCHAEAQAIGLEYLEPISQA